MSSDHSEADHDATCNDESEEIQFNLNLPERFKDLDDVSEFYTRFGWYHGFDIRRGHSKNEKGGNKAYVKFECAYAGVSSAKNGSRIRQPRPNLRCKCQARLYVSRQKNDSYVPTKFDNTHNHECRAPQDRRQLKCHRYFDYQKFIFAILFLFYFSYLSHMHL